MSDIWNWCPACDKRIDYETVPEGAYLGNGFVRCWECGATVQLFIEVEGGAAS
jgi:hypothetical protein